MKSINQDISRKFNLRFAALLFLLLNFVLISSISLTRGNFFYEHFENFSPDKISLVLVAFIFVLLAYCILFFEKKEKFSKKEIIAIVLILFFSFLTPPFLSRDISGYLIGGRNFVWFHVNPYSIGLNSVSANAWLAELGEGGWLRHPFSYGPIFLIVASFSVLLNFAHLISAVYFYKLFVFIAYALSVVVFAKLTKALSLNYYLFVLFALNPAILINGLVDGHNEVFIILLLLLAIYFIIKKNDYRGYLFWIISVFIKYNTVIFLPIFWK
jgi:hypothetical protein